MCPNLSCDPPCLLTCIWISESLCVPDEVKESIHAQPSNPVLGPKPFKDQMSAALEWRITESP